MPDFSHLPGHATLAVHGVVSTSGGQSAPAPRLGLSTVRVRVWVPGVVPHVTEQAEYGPKSDTTQSPAMNSMYVHEYVAGEDEPSIGHRISHWRPGDRGGWGPLFLQ
jgi:hypothetical protein